MVQRQVDELEAGVDRLVEAYSRVKAENQVLKDQVQAMGKQQNYLRERLDGLLARLEKAGLK